jgi:hypothetical protein
VGIINFFLLDFGENCLINQSVGGNCSLYQKGLFMPITDFVGKVLYPRKQRWEQRRNVKSLFVAVLITFIVIALFGLAVILKGSVHMKLDVPLQAVQSASS